MPPRKRARVSQATSPAVSAQPKTPTPAEATPDPEEDILNDPWTDEEEIGLFKGLIKWKPTGIHKHFHLLSLHQFLLEGDYIHPRNEHTKPAGIWRKLQTLYNLEALDEREDARQLDKVELDEEEAEGSDEEDEDVYSEAANKIESEDFDLAGIEWENLKWANRLASEKQRRDESPPVLPELNMAEEPPMRFTPNFSIEPSEAATPRGRRRGGRAASGRGKTGVARALRSTRQSDSAPPDDEEAEEDAAEDVEEETNEESEEEGEGSETATPAAKSTRTRGGYARGRARGRGRGRGRAG